MAKPGNRRFAHSIIAQLPLVGGRRKAATGRPEENTARDDLFPPRIVTGQGTGRARLIEPSDGIVVAGATVRLVFEYVAGSLPLPAGSRILLCFYHVCLWSAAQTHKPDAAGYVVAAASTSITVKAWGDAIPSKKYKLTQFPWHHVIEITVSDGGLTEGDSISIVYGAGEAQAIASPFAATPYNFRVIVIPPGAAPEPAEEHPSLSVIGGPAARLVLVTPSDHYAGSGRLIARLEDVSGNLATGYSGTLSVHLKGDKSGARSVHYFEADDPPVHLFEVVHGANGVGRFIGRTDTGLVAASNPFRVHGEGAQAVRTLWGEIHGHSNMSDGYGAPEEYFAYARDVAGLDVACLTDHDFMLSDADWQRVKYACNAANESGRFATVQAYEWSGMTEVGGDRNLYFSGDDPPIRRSRTLYDPTNPFVYQGAERQVNHIRDLYLWLDHELGPEAVVLIPHFGGRPANPRFHDPRYEPLVEIFSEHRRIEDFVDGFRAQGGQVGVVGGGDDHIGRPGNGFLLHGPFKGGLGLVALKSELSRSDVFDALRERRAYATTGARMIVDFEVAGALIGSQVAVAGQPLVAFAVVGTAPLKHIQIFRQDLVVHELFGSSMDLELEGEWVDEDFAKLSGSQFYWLRVAQVDGHVAVTSPVWIDQGPLGQHDLTTDPAYA